MLHCLDLASEMVHRDMWFKPVFHLALHVYKMLKELHIITAFVPQDGNYEPKNISNTGSKQKLKSNYIVSSGWHQRKYVFHNYTSKGMCEGVLKWFHHSNLIERLLVMRMLAGGTRATFVDPPCEDYYLLDKVLTPVVFDSLISFLIFYGIQIFPEM